MDFTFSDEQEAFRSTVRQVVDDLVAGGRVRAMVDGDDDAVAAWWATATELGLPGLLVPAASGGLGLGMVDAVVALEELGRATVPGPFLSSAVTATAAAVRLGLDDRLADLAAGTATATVALDEQGHGDPVERVRTWAHRTGARWELTGDKPIVLDGGSADWVLVAARTGEGLRSFVIERPTTDEVPTIDPTRRCARLHLDRTPARPVGPDGDQTAIWRDLADLHAVALTAELVGVGDAALAASIAYTGTRVQFDVPLSSHQVVQHKLVDMLHRLERGRVGVHFAAWAIDTDDPARDQAAAIAVSAMTEAAVAITADTIQVHGAVGFTWDHPAHLLYKRAKQNDVLAGSAAWHRRRLADALLGSPS